MPQVKILSVRSIASTKPGRAGQPATWVMYKHPESGDTRSVFIEKRDPTQVELEVAIAADIRGNAAQAGREFTI